MCAQLFTIAYTKAIKNELKGLEEDMKAGFTTLQSTMNNFKTRIQSSMHDWEIKWENKFGESVTSDLLYETQCVTHMLNVIDETINIKLRSIEGALESILKSLPTPNDIDSIQTPSDIYSRSWPLASVQDSEGQPHPSPIRSLADSLQQAAGTASSTRQREDKAVGTASSTREREDKAVGTASGTRQLEDKAVGTASITLEWQDEIDNTNTRMSFRWFSGVSALPHIDVLRNLPNSKAGAVAKRLLHAVAEHLPKAGAVAKCLRSTVAQHLLKDHERIIVLVVVISTIALYCTYTVQEVHIVVPV